MSPPQDERSFPKQTRSVMWKLTAECPNWPRRTAGDLRSNRSWLFHSERSFCVRKGMPRLPVLRRSWQAVWSIVRQKQSLGWAILNSLRGLQGRAFPENPKFRCLQLQAMRLRETASWITCVLFLVLFSLDATLSWAVSLPGSCTTSVFRDCVS